MGLSARTSRAGCTERPAIDDGTGEPATAASANVAAARTIVRPTVVLATPPHAARCQLATQPAGRAAATRYPATRITGIRRDTSRMATADGGHQQQTAQTNQPMQWHGKPFPKHSFRGTPETKSLPSSYRPAESANFTDSACFSENSGDGGREVCATGTEIGGCNDFPSGCHESHFSRCRRIWVFVIHDRSKSAVQELEPRNGFMVDGRAMTPKRNCRVFQICENLCACYGVYGTCAETVSNSAANAGRMPRNTHTCGFSFRNRIVQRRFRETAVAAGGTPDASN